MHYIPPLLETTFSKLDNTYPHYHQSLCSPSVSSQLKRYVSDLFGILQLVLRARTFNIDNRAKDLDQHIFLQCAKFAQLSDETVHQWIEDPMSIIDESAESLNELIVRTAVLNCAGEVLSPSFFLIIKHFQSSMAEYWVQYYKSIQAEYGLCEKEGLMVVGEPRKRHFVSFFLSLNQVKTCKTPHSKPKSKCSSKKHCTQQVPPPLLFPVLIS